MTEASAGFEGKVQITTDASSSGTGSTFSEVGGVQSADGSGILAPQHTETTELGDPAPRREQVQVDSSLSMDLTYDPSDTPQSKLEDYALNGTKFKVEYSPNSRDGQATVKVFDFVALVSSFDPANDTSDVATLSIEVQVADGTKVSTSPSFS